MDIIWKSKFRSCGFAMVVLICAALFNVLPAQAKGRLSPTATFPIRVPPQSTAGGLTFDGASLWISVQSVCDPDRFLQYSLKGKEEQTVLSPREGNPGGGMAFDGSSLYNLNYNTNMNTGLGAIDRFSLGGEFLDSIKLADGQYNTFGLTWSGEGLFLGHSPTVKRKSFIYFLDPQGRELKRVEVPLYISGLAWDGTHLWASAGKFKTLHKLNADLQVVRIYEVAVPLADITFAEGSLWGIEQNANRLHRFELQNKR